LEEEVVDLELETITTHKSYNITHRTSTIGIPLIDCHQGMLTGQTMLLY
jgi:hypothetical protein